jgi:hypothetical protein
MMHKLAENTARRRKQLEGSEKLEFVVKGHISKRRRNFNRTLPDFVSQ